MRRLMEPHIPASFLPRCKTQIEPNTSGITRPRPTCLRRKSYKDAVGSDVEFFTSKRRARTGQPTEATSIRDVVHINNWGAFRWGRRTKQKHPAKRQGPASRR